VDPDLVNPILIAPLSDKEIDDWLLLASKFTISKPRWETDPIFATVAQDENLKQRLQH
jgi:hypothetical protein